MVRGKKTKFVFVTGGVVSSLGKGLAATMPLPMLETTPPVTNTNLTFFPLTMDVPFPLYPPEAISARARSRSSGVSTPNPR